jgi:hypothetical protein
MNLIKILAACVAIGGTSAAAFAVAMYAMQVNWL